jgi:phage terminase large subunit-like protein
VSEALDVLAGLVLENGARWGETAQPWQWTDARAILEPGSDDPRSHFLTRPRGASKTTDLAGVATAALLTQLTPAARAYAVASDADQARLLVDALAGFVMRTPGIGGALQADRWRVTATRTGASLEVLPADGPSAWGLLPAFAVVDEIAQWKSTPGPKMVWDAVYSAVPKVPDGRLVVMTSAGDPSHWSYKVLTHAKRSKAWRVLEVPGPTPWIDPAALEDQRALLPESSYRRLHLNQWTSAEDRLTSVEALRDCVTLDGPLRPQHGQRYVVALDVGLKHDRTVAAVCHAEPLDESTRWRPPSTGDLQTDRSAADADVVSFSAWYGRRDAPRRWERPESPWDRSTPRREHHRGSRVVLDRMQVWQGSRRNPVRLSEVEEWVVQAASSFKSDKVIFDPFQMVGTAQRLQERGIKVEEFVFSSASVGRLASTLHLLLRDRALALPDDPELLDELANVRLRETSPGVLRMDHDADKHDDRAITLAMAAHDLLNNAPSGFVGQYRYKDRRLTSGRRAR